MSRGELRWEGKLVSTEVQEAARKGINQIMADCVKYAMHNHPGWQNRTGTAQGSIRVVKVAAREGAAIVGYWGSVACDYFKWLEAKYGHCLQNSAEVYYKELPARIRANLK